MGDVARRAADGTSLHLDDAAPTRAVDDGAVEDPRDAQGDAAAFPPGAGRVRRSRAPGAGSGRCRWYPASLVTGRAQLTVCGRGSRSPPSDAACSAVRPSSVRAPVAGSMIHVRARRAPARAGRHLSGVAGPQAGPFCGRARGRARGRRWYSGVARSRGPGRRGAASRAGPRRRRPGRGRPARGPPGGRCRGRARTPPRAW